MKHTLRELPSTTSLFCGVFIMGFAYAMLFYVIYKLHDVWTVKLYIIPDHRIEKKLPFQNSKTPQLLSEYHT